MLLGAGIFDGDEYLRGEETTRFEQYLASVGHTRDDVIFDADGGAAFLFQKRAAVAAWISANLIGSWKKWSPACSMAQITLKKS